MTYRIHAGRRRRRIRRRRATGLLVAVATIAVLAHELLASSSSSATSPTEAVPSTVWPSHGQSAFVQSGTSQVQAGPNQHPAAIASVAKVMTAYLVLRDHPLQAGEEGRTITLTGADVAATERRQRQQESVVSIAAGERLTELQAL